MVRYTVTTAVLALVLSSCARLDAEQQAGQARAPDLRPSGIAGTAPQRRNRDRRYNPRGRLGALGKAPRLKGTGPAAPCRAGTEMRGS